MSAFIGYPQRKVLAVFDTPAGADAGGRAAARAGAAADAVERFEGARDADRFDASGERHGVVARGLRAVQFSLMDQLPAMAWYEAALHEGKAVVAIRTRNRTETLRIVEALRGAGGHFINRFGRLATEEFVRWQGPEPPVPSLMKH
ncbi:MAG: hypothetical protein HYX55_02160 [Chloroflexi bacterium]|nr:hypothetical protein [Chloroflexota bacterium]